MVYKFRSFKLSLSFEVLLNLILLAVIGLLLVGVFTLKTLEKGIGTLQVENGTIFLASMESYIKSQKASFKDDVQFNKFLDNYLQLINSAFSDGEIVLFKDGGNDAFTKFGRMYRKDSFVSTLNQKITTNLSFYKDDIGDLLNNEKELVIYYKFEVEKRKMVLKGTFSLNSLRVVISNAKKWIIIISIFFGYILIFFGLFLFSRNVTNPLKRLSKSILALTQNNLYFPVEEKGPREIRELTASFNGMLEVLKEKEEKLKENIKKLEAEQEKSIRAEKMASLGKISSGLAHEVGNPLGAVAGYCEVALKLAESSPDLKEIIENIYEQTQRINETVKDFLDYARVKSSEISNISLKEIIDSSLSLFSVGGKYEKVKVINEFDEGILIKGDKNKLIQVFINILLNAYDAVNEYGIIKISSEKTNGIVGITITDDGCGISEEDLKYVFEPFFTTKESGSGTGLGLSICQSIIESMNGSISVKSKLNEGTSVKIKLPEGK